jgi:hypothetical protein
MERRDVIRRVLVHVIRKRSILFKCFARVRMSVSRWKTTILHGSVTFFEADVQQV